MVVNKIVSLHKEVVGRKRSQKPKIIKAPTFDYSFPWSFFDGVNQG